jgi:hypothetical protein
MGVRIRSIKDPQGLFRLRETSAGCLTVLGSLVVILCLSLGYFLPFTLCRFFAHFRHINQLANISSFDPGIWYVTDL